MTFFNIFSKRRDENKPLKAHKIIVDRHEKNSLVASELVKEGLEIEFQQLAVADYLVNDVALERKTITDLKSSIINKRVMQQLPELKQYPKYALILEGFNESSYEGVIHENALRGFLLAIVLDYQVPIIYTLNEFDTAQMAVFFCAFPGNPPGNIDRHLILVLLQIIRRQINAN